MEQKQGFEKVKWESIPLNPMHVMGRVLIGYRPPRTIWERFQCWRKRLPGVPFTVYEDHQAERNSGRQ